MHIVFQYILPHRIIAKIADLSANCTIPWIKNYLIRYFINRYAVNMSEAIEENPFAYSSYNNFFTRRLKPACRPIDPDPKSIVSPADGAIADLGSITAEKIIPAKGHAYDLNSLLGGDQKLSAPFLNGKILTVYLAPKDYHRVHMPFSGTLEKMIYIPGKLFSVSTQATENIPNLFARNERVVCIFNTSVGKMAVILVGAMIVGSIETVWAGVITPPHYTTINVWDYRDTEEKPIELEKGTELGLFKLGSTVITLFEHDVNTWLADLSLGIPIKMGAKVGFT